MTTDGEAPSTFEADAPLKAPRRLTGVRTLMAMVACCGLIFWAWRRMSENLDPALVEARSIQQQAILDLHSGEPTGRIDAIHILERLSFAGDSASIAPLIGALGDPTAGVRAAAARAVGSLVSGLQRASRGDSAAEAAAPALIRCMTDDDEEVRVEAAEALGSIARGLAASGAGAETVEAATTALIGGSKDPSTRVRTAATRRLGLMAPLLNPRVVLAPLAELLRDPEAGVRREAIVALTSQPEGGDPPETLAAAFEDPSAENRKAALARLASYKQGLDPWVPVLFRLIEHDPARDVQDECRWAMPRPFRPPAITTALLPSLTASLGSKDVRIRTLAAELLGGFGNDALAAVPDLLRILDEPPASSKERAGSFTSTEDPSFMAASALARIAPGTKVEKDVVTALIAVVRSRRTMQRSGPASHHAGAALQCDGAIRALSSLGTAAEEAVPSLVSILEGVEAGDRITHEGTVVLALSSIAPGTPSAGRTAAVLLPCLRSGPPSSRIEAIEAIAPFAQDSADVVAGIRSLENAPDDRVRKAAANALSTIDKPATP